MAGIASCDQQFMNSVSKPLTPHSHLMIQEYLTETNRTINFASEKRKPNRFEGCRQHLKTQHHALVSVRSRTRHPGWIYRHFTSTGRVHHHRMGAATHIQHLRAEGLKDGVPYGQKSHKSVQIKQRKGFERFTFPRFANSDRWFLSQATKKLEIKKTIIWTIN